ncbi:MAG: hypothetical protein HKN45_03930 [Flavobacteriales bacterium]|nr:hypothetical protein [Flavobacteriales bacterium]NNK80782.1 hypothetical protein [Flavobacteriales bacterium]
MKYLLTFFSILFLVLSSAQGISPEKDIELGDLYQAILDQESDESKLIASAEFKSQLKSTLFKSGAFQHPFAGLNMCKLTSPDDRFRIFNWNVPLDRGEHFYEALVVIPNGKSGMVEVIELRDMSAEIERPEHKILKSDKWFGTLYYEIVPFKRSGGDHYALLGWDGDSQITTKKVIDVMVVSGNNVRFGAPVFKTERGLKKRLLFTYAEQVSMSLIYQEKERRFIFDHLAPKESRLEGQYQFYGPDMSFNALNYRKGKWAWVSDVEFKRKRTNKDKDFNDPRVK